MRVVDSLSYYDKILLAVAISLAGGFTTGMVTPVRLQLGLLAGALGATVFVYHAMFQNPPRPPASTTARAAMIVWHAFLLVLLVASIYQG